MTGSYQEYMRRKAGGGLRPAFHETPLVGHDGALTTIGEQLDALLQGQGGRYAIQAESGVGKSRLAWEAIDAARHRGMVGVYIPCRGSDVRPYDPLSILLRVLLNVDASQSIEVQREQAREIVARWMMGELTGAVLKMLGVRGTSPLEEPDEDAENAGTLLLNEDVSLPDVFLRLILAWLADEDSPNRALLVFDDLGEASQVVQDVVHDLALGLQEKAVFILVTYTSSAPPEVHAVFTGRVVEAQSLSEAETSQLGAALLEVPHLPEEQAELFWNMTAGRLLLIHLMAHYVKTHDDPPPVRNIRGVVADRISSLPQGERDTLLPATVLGSGMRIGALRTLRGDVREEELYHDLTALVESGWLEESGNGRLKVYRFAHRMLQSMIYHSIPEPLLNTLHTRAGDYYAVPATGRKLRTETALTHYLKANNTERAMSVIDMALAEAKRTGDRGKMLHIYRRGAEIARRDFSMSERQAEMAERLGDHYAAAGDYAAAVQVYRELAPADSSLIIHSKLALMLIVVEPAQAARVLPELIQNVQPGQMSDLHWRLRAGYIWALALSGYEYEALRYSRDSLSQLSHTAGLGDSRTLLRGTLGMAMHYQGERDSALTHLESARAGWGARGVQDGVLLMNKVLIDTPQQEISRSWLRFVIEPFLTLE